ncbi:MAG TPA: nucleoside triphosphate pyrophosphohydrolase [Bacteroidetes bacterium]|nr:nucleoside triphosphate pyrophosphohydrolase [Bacteroidota bacterium]
MTDARLIAFERLLNIMDELREKCPWDKKQTMESLRHLSIEEVYELSEAILRKDSQEIKKELGDVLLHIVFYARIASETGDFTITEVINALCEKLIVRHPHIYGDVIVKDDDDVKRNWEQIKMKETGGNKQLLAGVPASLASLVKAYRMQEKAAQVGFDWPDKQQVWKKVEEELLEFETATTTKDREEEFGDLLFALVNYARFEGINPDDALEKTNIKFKQRFEYIESKAEAAGLEMKKMTLEEMDIWWNEAKAKENKQA